MPTPQAKILNVQGHPETHISLIGLRALGHGAEPNQLHHHEGIVPLTEQIRHQQRLRLGPGLDPPHDLARDLDAQRGPFVRDPKARREGEVEPVGLDRFIVEENADVELGGFGFVLVQGLFCSAVRDLVSDAERVPCAV